MRSRCILIIHPEGNARNNPTVNCIIDFFIERQFLITYVSSESYNFSSSNGIKFIKRSSFFERLKRKLFNKYCLIWPSKIFSLLRNINFFFKYDLIVSVDREGLIEAASLSKFLRIPLLHCSFEIYFHSETSKNFKKIEIEASKQVDFWIIQDEIRAKALVEENKLLTSKSILIPVSSRGLGEFSEERLRDKLGILPHIKVAIFMGSLYPWTMFKQVLDQAGALPDNWAIIINERYGQAQKYLLDLSFDKSSIGKNIYISNENMEFVDKMGYVLSGIDAGIAFYDPTFEDPSSGLNLVNLGLASGKIATYLRYGVPIVINQIGLYATLANDNNFGIVIGHPDELSEALSIIQKTDGMSLNAKKFFSQKLDFDIYKERLLEILPKLIP
jgi:glycosyltransferase involved in cell wall biosynthesis